MANKINIAIKKGVEPYPKSVSMRVAASRKLELKEELQNMGNLGVIQKIEQLTEWCSPSVLVSKPNGKLKVCTDIANLNKAVNVNFTHY